jgi:hypothetical protein
VSVTKPRKLPVNHLTRRERQERWADAEREGLLNGAFVISGKHDNTRYVWQHAIAKSDLPAMRKHIATQLSLFGKADGTRVFPGVRELAKRASLTGRSISSGIDALVRAGWLRRTARFSGKPFEMGVRYDLCVPAVAWTERFERSLKPKTRADSGSALPVEYGSTDGAEGDSARVERSSTPGTSQRLQPPSKAVGVERRSEGAEGRSEGAEPSAGGAAGRSAGVLNHVQPSLPSEYSKELSKQGSKHSVQMSTVRAGRQVEKKEEAFEERKRKALKLLRAIPDLSISVLKTQAHLTDHEARELHAEWREGSAVGAH